MDPKLRLQPASSPYSSCNRHLAEALQSRCVQFSYCMKLHVPTLADCSHSRSVRYILEVVYSDVYGRSQCGKACAHAVGVSHPSPDLSLIVALIVCSVRRHRPMMVWLTSSVRMSCALSSISRETQAVPAANRSGCLCCSPRAAASSPRKSYRCFDWHVSPL